jgi:hypothetical protein
VRRFGLLIDLAVDSNSGKDAGGTEGERGEKVVSPKARPGEIGVRWEKSESAAPAIVSNGVWRGWPLQSRKNFGCGQRVSLLDPDWTRPQPRSQKRISLMRVCYIPSSWGPALVIADDVSPAVSYDRQPQHKETGQITFPNIRRDKSIYLDTSTSARSIRCVAVLAFYWFFCTTRNQTQGRGITPGGKHKIEMA